LCSRYSARTCSTSKVRHRYRGPKFHRGSTGISILDNLAIQQSYVQMLKMLKATLFSRAGPRALRTCTLRPAIQPQRSRFCHQLSHPTRPSRPGTPSHLLKRQWPQARRHASTREAATKLFKEYPFSVSLATALYDVLFIPTFPSAPTRRPAKNDCTAYSSVSACSST
jgi:hypothetical protein